MKFTTFCIKRPVFSAVLSLVIILAGIMCFFSLNMRYFPNVSSHTAVITTTYSGASAQLIANEINSKIEESLGLISGVDSLISKASTGHGEVRITFVAGVNFSEKANEVRDKVAAARSVLPKAADAPVIWTNSHSDLILSLGFIDPNRTPVQIRDYLDRFIVDRLRQINGVGEVELWGANKYAMRVWLSPEKMAAHGVTVDDIKKTLEANNVQLPLGELSSKTMRFPVSDDTTLKQAIDFDRLIIKNSSGEIIRLGDVARTELGLENDPVIVHVDGKEGVGLGIFLEDGANAIEVAKRIKQELKWIEPTLPAGMKIIIPMDISPFYQSSIHEVYHAIFLAILCVLLVIFIFLGSLRSVIIPVVTIPICVIGVFSIISLCGFTINMLTLLAIVLSIGLVVDDAIVMLENIYRHVEEGSTPFHAAMRGSKEISFSVIAMTLTLVAAYAPIGFLNTETASLFREFAFTLAGAVLISGFVALTLSPSLCAQLLRPHQKREQGYHGYIERLYERLKHHYKKLLTHILQHRLLILGIAFILAVSGIAIFRSIPSKFLPDENSGIILSFYNTAPGSNTAYTENYLNQMEKILVKTSTIQHVLGFALDNQLEILMTLNNTSKKTYDSLLVARELQGQFQKTPGMTGFIKTAQPFSGGWNSHDLEFYVLSSSGYSSLSQTVNQLMDKLNHYPAVARVDNSIKFDSQEYNVSIHRDFAESTYVNASDINNTLSTLLGSSHITDFLMNDRTYQVLVQAEASQVTDTSALGRFYVKNILGKMIPLSGLVTLTPRITQSSLSHYNRLPAALMMIDLKPGYNLSDAVQYLQNTLPKWLPENTQYSFIGKAKKLLETGSSMGLLFVLAVIFIYLILAAQFESFIDPLIILLTVPLSVVGALAVLKVVGGSINLYTEIGLITLVGLVTKHGILITKFANEILSEGKSVKESVLTAAAIRLRPILMTTAAMILGALPLVLSSGAGAKGRSEIGYVIIGGLFFGTFFSLILVPVVYTYIKHKMKKAHQ